MFNHAGLQRTAVAVIGQEITNLQRWKQIRQHMKAHVGSKYNGKEMINNSAFHIFSCVVVERLLIIIIFSRA